MAGAPLFATAALMKRSAASVVMGSDRYVITGETIEHVYGDAVEVEAKLTILRAALESFGKDR
jgi:hypothetical protein